LTSASSARYHNSRDLAKDFYLILLTKLDKSSVLVNVESIKYIETMPDTLIFFLNGDTLIVSESIDYIAEKVIELKARIIKKAAP
jgi:uncharacterized protein YlzI (FlbEa/FlbD family)